MPELDEDRRKRLQVAISDPGSVLPRVHEHDDGRPAHELVTHWQMRAVEAVIGPWLGRHDPDGDCDCHPDDLMREGICEFRMLADSVGHAFNPPDADEAEISILLRAVECAAEFIGSLPCTCPQGDHRSWADNDPCARCATLGQWRGKPVDR